MDRFRVYLFNSHREQAVVKVSEVKMETTMRAALPFAAVLALAAFPAFASGPIYDACLASPESKTTSVDCGCAQDQADKHLSAADQQTAAGFIAKTSDPMTIIQSMGQDEALRFVGEFQKWGEAAHVHCGAPSPRPPG